MDYLIDKEMTARSYPESGGQRLSIQMEISDEWFHSGVSTGTAALQYLSQ